MTCGCSYGGNFLHFKPRILHQQFIRTRSSSVVQRLEVSNDIVIIKCSDFMSPALGGRRGGKIEMGTAFFTFSFIKVKFKKKYLLEIRNHAPGSTHHGEPTTMCRHLSSIRTRNSLV